MSYVIDLISLTIWLLGQPTPNRKFWQVCADRWVRVFGHNRAGFGCFEKFWVWIGRHRRFTRMPPAVVDEFLILFHWGALLCKPASEDLASCHLL